MNNRIIIFLVILTASFTVTGCSTGDDGASPPILLLASEEQFGLFTAEILKTEGFNNFTTGSPKGSRITNDYLEQFDIVILTATPVTTDEEKIFKEYVRDGGNLIAFRPDKKFSELFGINDAGGKLNDAYVAIDVKAETGKGLIGETLQFHGEADKYYPGKGHAIATFFGKAATATEFPAVVRNAFGNGEAIAFLYNLPESVVLTRQGKYRDAGKEMDGILGIRAMDMFTYGWVDTSKNTLNQADEQMRLLSHCIETLSRKRPIPRFWYFPDTLKCLVTLNSDGEDSKEADFIKQFEDADAKGAKMTLYVKEVEFVSKEWVDTWRNKGFEISGHPDDTKQAASPDWNSMDSVYKALLRELDVNYGIPSMETVTNHWFVWVGNNQDGSPNFAAQALIEENHGVGLDCNYAHYDNGSSHGHFLGKMGTRQGNYTGSGLAMRFADISGKIIDVYQQLNNVYDQQYMEHEDQEGYFNAFRGLMERSLNNEAYSTISVRAHSNEYFFSEIPLMKMLDYANSKNIPVWTELQFLQFLRMKDEASFQDITWSGHTLSFEINSLIEYDRGLTCLIPFTFNGSKVKHVTVNDEEYPYSVKPMKGFEYAWLTVKPGRNYKVEVEYD